MGMELCQSDKIGGLRIENRPSSKKYIDSNKMEVDRLLTDRQ